MRRFSRVVLLAGALLPSPGVAGEVVDRVVAIIEDDIITLRELDAKVAPYLAQLTEIKDAEARSRKHQQLREQVLNIEIGERIVNREIEANKDRLGVGDKDVDRAVEEVIKMNHLTREQLQSALYGQGLTWSEYRAKLREQIERARLIQFKVQGKIQINDADVRRRCLERSRSSQNLEVCASHILFDIPAGASDEAVEALRAQASQLQAVLAAGADFAAYALKYSADKAAPDGKLGCFHRGEMVEAFEQAAFNLKVSEVSAVIRTSYGFHIIKVTDRRAASTSGSCEQPAALEAFHNELYQEEMQQQMDAWVEELRKKAFVEVRL